MKTHRPTVPGFVDGLVAALVISIGVAFASVLLSSFVGNPLRWMLLVDGAALAYIVYLLRRGEARVGRIVVVSAWLALAAGAWLLGAPVFELVLLQGAFIWLVRALYFHPRLATAVLDLGLVSAGLAAAAWASVNTLSPTAAIWSFLLVQALFCWIPGIADPDDDPGRPRPVTPFQSAQRAAHDALRKIHQP